MGARVNPMIGSARFSRSYGFTHGSIELQPVDAKPRTVSNIKPRSVRMTFSLLLQHRPDLREIDVLVARLVAAMDLAHVALAIDEHRGRHASDLIELADFAVDVEGDREGHLLRQLAQPAFRVAGGRLDVDT